ncbi:DUF2183 domain-containing protein [Bacteriovoracaceae bacterium]|nr:DUF2183 domain-containing protein [Bacteriovoracaceae bacterium]
MINKRIVCFLLFGFLNLSFTKTIIISDFDDTIKRTNAGSIVPMIFNSTMTKRVFWGMPTLYKNMIKNEDDRLYIITGSPNIVRKRIFKLLKKYKIKLKSKKDLITRHLIKEKNTAKYKEKNIRKIITKNGRNGVRYIFVGDNVGKDPFVYNRVKKSLPNVDISIYIHKVKPEEKYPGDFNYYYSSLGLASYIAEESLFSKLVRIFRQSLRNIKLKRVFPKYSVCPSPYKISNSRGHDLSSIEFWITRKCEERNGKNG